jgi:hypothetical protein
MDILRNRFEGTREQRFEQARQAGNVNRNVVVVNDDTGAPIKSIRERPLLARSRPF